MTCESDRLAVLCSNVADGRSRAVFEEAVRCFQAKAYRSAVVALWISVVFDLMLKAEASVSAPSGMTLDDLKEARKDKNKMLKLEQVILDYAFTGLNLIDRYEYILLDRLRQDRCSCAHPEFADGDKLLCPDADSVLFAMTVAVRAVLAKSLSRRAETMPVMVMPSRSSSAAGALEAPLGAKSLVKAASTVAAGTPDWAAFIKALQQGGSEGVVLRTCEPLLVNLTSGQFTKLLNVLVTSKAMRDKPSVYERLYKAVRRHNLPDMKAVKRLQAATLSDEAAVQAKQKLCQRLNDMVESMPCH